MGAPLSLDLRSRVVQAYEEGNESYEYVAQQFRIGSATLKRFVRRKREDGNLQPLTSNCGSPSKIIEEHITELKRLVDNEVDITEEELAAKWSEKIGFDVSRSTTRRALKKAHYTLKKRAGSQQKGIRKEINSEEKNTLK